MTEKTETKNLDTGADVEQPTDEKDLQSQDQSLDGDLASDGEGESEVDGVSMDKCNLVEGPSKPRFVDAVVQRIEKIDGLDDGTTVAIAVVTLPDESTGCVALDEDSCSLDEEGKKIEVGTELQVQAKKVRQLWNWVGLVRAYQQGQPVKAKVLAQVKAGLMVNVGQKAFLPASQVALHPIQDLSIYVNLEFPVLIIRLDSYRMNVVVSRRALMEEERKESAKESITKMEVGQQMTGTVRSLVSYGAFIDLGGIDALLHVSDLTWGKPKPLEDLVRVGQKVEVVILKIDEERGRIAVGIKQLTPDPWLGVEGRFPVGTVHQGTVVGCTEFGAFVELEPEVEGMVHVSEIDWADGQRKPATLLPVGTHVEVKVLECDESKRRIGLSRKALMANPWNILAQELEPGTRLTCPVTGVADFGVFVRLGEEIKGLVHRGEIAWDSVPEDLQSEFPAGKEVDVVVLEIDPQRRRASLSIKQALANPWDGVEDRVEVGAKIKGAVLRIVDFGAFVQVEPGVEGLVHVSQLSDNRVKSPYEVVKVGDEVEAMVVALDSRRRRLSLSMRSDAQPLEEEKVTESAPRAAADTKEYTPDSAKAGTSLGDLLRDKFGDKADEEKDA